MAKEQKQKESTIIEHLDELRKRILISCVFILIFSVLAYAKSSFIIAMLKQPLGNIDLVFLAPIEGFMTKLKVALFGGIVLSSPIIFLETLLFISPALYKNEKILLFSSLPFIVGLFFGGIYFCYQIIMPTTLKYLMSFGNEYMKPMLSVDKYYSFITMFTLIMGLIFELPLIMLVLSKFGIINYKMLAKKRKYALLMIVVVTAVLTPTPDAFTLLAVALPLLFLFEISIGILMLFDKVTKRKKNKDEEIEEEIEEDDEEYEE